MESDLTTSGTTLTLETRGRRSGVPRRATIGFIEEGDALLVAASSGSTHWARNLLADSRCVIELRGRRGDFRAVALDGADRNAAVVALILKYGTPAERLGSGPAFRLEPA
jgi:deazaflavin-dependent oxidoreductase (nitroreductase family)